MSPLGPPIVQQDFAAGMFRGVARHLIPQNGFFDGRNCILDDDGLIKERGGVTDLTTSNFSANALTFLWAGHLGPGERIVFADNADFGVVDVAGTGSVNLGGAGLSEPKRAVEIGGVLFIGGGTLYGGSRKASDYSTGTVGVTLNSKTVTKASGFTANVDAGMLLRIGGAGRYYVVASVDSDTQITLRSVYQGATNAAASFALTRLGSTSAAPYKTADFYAHAADRLLALSGARVDFSDVTIIDPADATSGQGPHKYGTNDYHELPEGADGLGIWDVGTLSLVFSTKGVFAIRNLVYDLTDSEGNVQQSLDHVSPEIVLWGNPGIASYRSALVVPALDGVYLIDGISQPQPVALSIPELYRGYVEAGHKPGLATVYRGHYFLPILSSAGLPVDLLVCRLDRPVSVRGMTIFPWTRLAGSGSKISAFASRVSTPIPTPQLLGAANATRSRVLNCNSYFAQTAAVKKDSDGTAFTWELVTRDYELGRKPTQTKTMEIEYELDDAATDDPKIAAGYNTGSPVGGGSAWGVAHWGQDPWTDEAAGDFLALVGNAPEDPEGDTPHAFRVNTKTRRIRFRLSCGDPNSTLRLRGLKLLVRPNRKI